MRKVAPSLIVKGFDLSESRAPGEVRSMMMSGRPSTFKNMSAVPPSSLLSTDAIYLKTKGDDDDLAGVARVANGGSRSDAEALLPFSQALVVLVYTNQSSQQSEQTQSIENIKHGERES